MDENKAKVLYEAGFLNDTLSTNGMPMCSGALASTALALKNVFGDATLKG